MRESSDMEVATQTKMYTGVRCSRVQRLGNTTHSVFKQGPKFLLSRVQCVSMVKRARMGKGRDTGTYLLEIDCGLGALYRRVVFERVVLQLTHHSGNLIRGHVTESILPQDLGIALAHLVVRLLLWRRSKDERCDLRLRVFRVG